MKWGGKLNLFYFRGAGTSRFVFTFSTGSSLQLLFRSSTGVYAAIRAHIFVKTMI